MSADFGTWAVTEAGGVLISNNKELRQLSRDGGLLICTAAA
jgi:hypothetical protein